MPPHAQDLVQDHSLQDPESFWAYHAKQLHWHKPPYEILSRYTKNISVNNGSNREEISHESWSWFPGGEISTDYNCIDRHVANGRGENVAIIWESPVTKTRQIYTYSQLKDEVEVLAGVLREEGVKKGDVVLLYST
jgi:propionyl-CoA synthetase